MACTTLLASWFCRVYVCIVFLTLSRAMIVTVVGMAVFVANLVVVIAAVVDISIVFVVLL